MDNSSVSQVTSNGHCINSSNSTVSINEFKGLADNDIASHLVSLNTFICHRDFAKAKLLFDSLSSMQSALSYFTPLLSILEYWINLKQGIDSEINRDSFITLFGSSELPPVINDLVQAIHFEHLCKNNKSLAKSYYESNRSPGEYIRSSYYETLASAEELDNASLNLELLKEHTLCSIVRGYRKNHEFGKSVKISEFLFNNYQNDNSQFLLLFESTQKLFSEINEKHHWLINAEQDSRLKSLISTLIEFNNRTHDIRNIQIAAHLLYLTEHSDHNLLEICKSNLSETKKVLPDFGKKFNFLPAETLLNSSSSIDLTDFARIYMAICEGILLPTQFIDWIQEGGEVECEDPELIVLISILRKSIEWIALSETEQDIHNHLTEDEFQQLVALNTKLNPHILLQLCESFNRIRQPYQTIELLKPIIPDNPCESPLIVVYAYALRHNDQLAELQNLLNQFEDISSNLSLIIISIELEMSLDKYPRAIEMAELAVKKHPESLHSWYYLLLSIFSSSNTFSEKKIEEIFNASSKIPQNLLEEYSDTAFRILQIINCIDKNFVSNFALKWFVQDPENRVKETTSLFLSPTLNTLPKKEYTIPYTPFKGCTTGVTFRINKGEARTKLLVRNCSNTSHTIDSNSHLATQLLTAKPGDKIKVGMINYELVEHLPAQVAAFRIASQLRHENNTGDDCFFLLKFEKDNIEGFLKQLEEDLPKNNLLPPVLDSQNIPLLIRIGQHKNNTVRITCDYLLDIEGNQHTALSDIGSDEYDGIVIDCLTLLYLAYSGYGKSLIELNINLYITSETESIFNDWLSLPILVPPKNIGPISTSEDEIREDLKNLLRSSKVLKPYPFNMPFELTRMKHMFDGSHYSSLKLSASRSIPLLCFDHLMASLYNSIPEIPIANFKNLIFRIKNSSALNTRALSMNLSNNLYTPVLLKDLLTLSSGEKHNQELTYRLIDKYSYKINIYQLAQICYNTLISTNIKSKKTLQCSQQSFIEHIINHCCRAALLKASFSEDSFSSGEIRLAYLTAFTLKLLSNERVSLELAIELFSEFSLGHFIETSTFYSQVKSIIDDIGS